MARSKLNSSSKSPFLQPITGKRDAERRNERAQGRHVALGLNEEPSDKPFVKNSGRPDGSLCGMCALRPKCWREGTCHDAPRREADEALAATLDLLPGQRVLYGKVTGGGLL